MSGTLLSLTQFFSMAVQLGTPMLFATLGGILNERAGHMNLGIEGMMMLGASFGFYAAYYTGSVFLAVLAAGLAGLLGAALYAFITITLRGDQTVIGFSLTIFGCGLADVVGKRLAGFVLPQSFTAKIREVQLPLLSKIPVLGSALFSQDLYVQSAFALGILLFFYIYKTRPGLHLRMVGDDPAAADASGINVTLYKYAHVLFGGLLCGLGGGYTSLVYLSRWQDGITAGTGWISVALIIFSAWNPLRAVFGAYLFGMFRSLSLKFQGFSIVLFGLKLTVASQLMDLFPYAMTIVVLLLSAMTGSRSGKALASLGKPYFREDR